MSIRLILLLIGAVIILGIIIDSLWRKKRQENLYRTIHQQSQNQALEVQEDEATTITLQPKEKLQPVIIPVEVEPIIVDSLITEEVEIQQEQEGDVASEPKLALASENNLVIPAKSVAEMIEQELIVEEEIPEAPDSFLVLTVLAQAGKKFSGFELLQALLKAGLKFGEMNIFHRRRDLDHQSPIYFSVASLTNPGYFDIRNMQNCQTRGLNIFMSLRDVTDAKDVFEIMYATAQQLAKKLDGIVCDRHRIPLTPEVLAVYRAQTKTITKEHE